MKLRGGQSVGSRWAAGTLTLAVSGFALTVEYGAHPPRAKLRSAPRRILGLFGAWRGGVGGVPGG